jgi:serine/threonine protein kinase/tetratricopeptide (TPR) repeat protein
MTESVFSQIGPYLIRHEINQGGMATVYLAEDTRTGRHVALRRVVSRDQDVLDAERRGAELQQLFWQHSQSVPEIYETFTSGGAFVVAMEYLAGQDLSELIRSGPVDPARACEIAVAMCRFLEDARQFQGTVDGRQVRHLLHGDLTPRNIRLTAGGVYILDFGISKALSLSRKVTRNDFGNIAYLSPERLATGEMDATDGFWSVGVILYEMLAGRKPHHSADARRLEQLILSKQPPEPLPPECPEGLRAVIGKLLAADPASRYDSADAIRADLERVTSGQSTQAQAEGWPRPAVDEAATRRTHAAADEPTRPRARVTPPPLPPSATPPPASAARHQPGATSRGISVPAAPPWLRISLAAAALGTLLGIIGLVANEARVYRGAGRAIGTVRTSEIGDLPALWRRYATLSDRSYLRIGVWRLASELTERSEALADRVIRNYSTGVSGIREAQWEQARVPLVRAARVDPGDRHLRASLRFIEGHLHRIDGDGHTERKRLSLAQREYAEALTAFREAAELRPEWPEPFLGLARTFIASLADLEKGENALAQAQRLGRVALEPETRLLAAGYRRRGDLLAASAAKLAETPQEELFLTRARHAYQRSLDLYASLPGGSPAEVVRASQRGLTRVEDRLGQLVSVPVPEEASASTPVVNLVPQ